MQSKPYTFIPYTGEYFTYYNKKQHDRQYVLLHNALDVKNIIHDLQNENGNAWIALYEDNPVGIAFAKPVSKTTIAIKEILYDNPHVKEYLIHNILNEYNAQRAEVRIPANTEKTYPYGLACILDNRVTNISDAYMSLMLD